MITKRTKPSVLKATREKEFAAQAQAMVAVFFEISDEMGLSWTELAEESTLCRQTLYRLWEWDYARCPQLFTLMHLAAAVGLELSYTDETLKVSLAKQPRKTKERGSMSAAA